VYDQIKNYFNIIKLKIILIRIQSYMMKLFFNIQFSRNNYTNASARILVYSHIYVFDVFFHVKTVSYVLAARTLKANQ